MFNAQKANKSLRVVISGGGYAGLSALVNLKARLSDIEITLIDPLPFHVKITRLHESFRETTPSMTLPFETLERRFQIRHIQTRLAAEPQNLDNWNKTGRIQFKDSEVIDFDYLILSSGTDLQTVGIEPSEQLLTLKDLIDQPGPSLLMKQLGSKKSKAAWVTVVGGGPTGIQFLFELADFIRSQGFHWKLRLIDSQDGPLPTFPESMGHYVNSRLEDWGIEYIPQHLLLAQRNDEITIENRITFERQTLPSDLTLYFAGKKRSNPMSTNWFGQTKLSGKTLPRIFSAGDCSHFAGPGSNTLSAQSAVRKGRIVADNIVRRQSRFRWMIPYLHQELGYVVSLGPRDAIGWVGSKKNIIAGPAALSIKDVVESQYDLLLAGRDTFSF